TRRFPSRARLNWPTRVAAIGRASGAPRTFPLSSSIGRRQTFAVPPRLLAKKSDFPSGDQTGFQLKYLSSSGVTGRGASPPREEIVQSTRWLEAFGKPQKAMRCPCGDQLGATASLSVIRRFLPDSTSIAQSSPVPLRAQGLLPESEL